MKEKNALDVMEYLDSEIIEEADTYRKKDIRKYLYRGGALAACLCVTILGVLTFRQTSLPETPVGTGQNPGTEAEYPVDPPVSDDNCQYPVDPPIYEENGLKPLSIPEIFFGGMGFEGYLYYDIAELDNGNPWSESMKLSVLPVYRNGSYDETKAGIPKGLTETEMTELLEHTVSALGLHIGAVETDVSGSDKKGEKVIADPNPSPTWVRAVTENGTVMIQADGSIVYTLPAEGLPLPEEYRFTYSDTTDAEAEKVLLYLTDSYSALLDFDEPETVSYGDYTYDGVYNRSYLVYDTAGADTEDILNYNFRSVSFAPNDAGNLYLIRTGDHLRTAEKLGDYPIISVNAAVDRLQAGRYSTSVPMAFPGKEYIGKAELIYRTGRLEELLLPYYRFYVLLPGYERENGLKTYGVYYVPAIADEYIADMPVYDGSFN